MQWEEPIVYLDLERRVKHETCDRYFPDRLIDVRDVLVVDKHYNTDYYLSYLALKKEIESCLGKKEGVPATLVVDGITDVRNNYCKALWLHKNPGKRQPGKESWRLINEWTREILEPLMNLSKVLGLDLVFTAQCKDKYVTVSAKDEGKRVREQSTDGRVPNTKDWQNYGSSVLAELSNIGKKYFVKITKSPIGRDNFEITGRSLYGVLVEKGL